MYNLFLEPYIKILKTYADSIDLNKINKPQTPHDIFFQEISSFYFDLMRLQIQYSPVNLWAQWMRMMSESYKDNS